MKYFLSLLVLLLASQIARANSCIYDLSKSPYEGTNTVFIATITGVSDLPPDASLVAGDTYRLSYRYVVREIFRGDPNAVTAIYTNHLYNAYDAVVVHHMSLVQLVPGDNVLVVARMPGDVQIGDCDSKVWFPDSKELAALRSLK